MVANNYFGNRLLELEISERSERAMPHSVLPTTPPKRGLTFQASRRPTAWLYSVHRASPRRNHEPITSSHAPYLTKKHRPTIRISSTVYGSGSIAQRKKKRINKNNRGPQVAPLRVKSNGRGSFCKYPARVTAAPDPVCLFTTNNLAKSCARASERAPHATLAGTSFTPFHKIKLTVIIILIY